MGDWAPRSKDPEILTEYVRNALARTICQMHSARDGKIYCVTLDPTIEDLVSTHLERSDRGTFLTLAPETQSKIVAAARIQVEKAMQDSAGQNR